MRGAVAALALGLARESERDEPTWARPWLDACEPSTTVSQILRHRIADIASPILGEEQRFAGSADLLAADLRRTRLQSMALVAGWRMASEALRSADVPYLLVKGPALAAQTTGDWAARRSVDLDVLVDLAEVRSVAGTLEGAGFTLRQGFAPGPDRPLFAPTSKWLQELAFSSPRNTIDVHWRLDPSRGCLTWDFQDLWSRRVYVEVANTPVATLSPVDAALFNAVHAGKDCWSSLHDVRDQIRLQRVAGLSEEQWEAAFRDASCQVRWGVAQEMCRPVQSANAPSVARSLDHGRRARLLAGRLWRWLASGTSPASSGSARDQGRYLVANVASYDTPRAAIQRLGVVVWPVQEMAAESLGNRGTRHPWLYPATAPLHIPRRMARKARTTRSDPNVGRHEYVGGRGT